MQRDDDVGDDRSRQCWALTQKIRRCKNPAQRDSFLPLCVTHEHLPRAVLLSTIIGFIGLIIGSILLPELWYQIRGQDAVRDEIAVSLHAQADGAADRARRYVEKVLEPVASGGGAAWWPVQSGLSETLKRVWFADDQQGWVLAQRSVLSTSNGGRTWTAQHFDDVPGLNDFTVANGSVWVVGNEGVLLLGSPGTKKWARKDSGAKEQLYGIDFADDGATGWIAGADGLLLRTTDHGQSWTRQESGTQQNLIAVHAFDARRVWVGGAQASLATEDGGRTWAQIDTERVFDDVVFLDDSVGYAAYLHWVLRTDDGGHSWREFASGRNVNFRGLHFTDFNRGWLVAHQRQVFRTVDGGSTWTTIPTGWPPYLNDIHFVNDTTGWVVGHDGWLLNTAPLTFQIEDQTPGELLAMLQDSIASPYFNRTGALERVKELAEEHEAYVSALARLRDEGEGPQS